MRFYVTFHGEEYEVDLLKTPEGLLSARCGAEQRIVQLAEIEPLRRYSVLLDATSYDVMVDAEEELLHLQVGGRRLLARVEDDRQRAARRIGANVPQGATTVESMMPGILREVRVSVGDRVEAGQALVILEAMKMENEIRAEQPGVVSEVLVKAGMAVEGGTALLRLDPADP